jgi:RES domain-containing protein
MVDYPDQIASSQGYNIKSLDKQVAIPSVNRLLTNDWRSMKSESQSQAIGRALHVLGVEGVLVPSAIDPMQENIYWFPDNIQKNSIIEIIDCQNLIRRIRK